MKTTLIARRLSSFLAVIMLCSHCVKATSAKGHSTVHAGRESTAEPLMAKAEGFLAAGDNMRAEQYLHAALLDGADDARVLPLLVHACMSDQRYRDAAQYLEQHLRRHPTQQSARLVLAGVHLAIGQVQAARKEYESVLAADPKRAEAHYALATLLRDEVADHVAADAHFRAYLSLRPDGAHAEEARGSLLIGVR